MFGSLGRALRAAVLGTAVFWMVSHIVERAGWQAPYGLTSQAIFFVLFFLGILMAGSR